MKIINNEFDYRLMTSVYYTLTFVTSAQEKLSKTINKYLNKIK